MEDTIAAIATPYGEGGIGIIRISGEESERILDEVFEPFNTDQSPLSDESRRLLIFIISGHVGIFKYVRPDIFKRLFTRFVPGAVKYFFQPFGAVERILAVVRFGDAVGVQKQMRFSSMWK